MRRLIVHGAAGRLGRRIVALALRDPDWELVAGYVRPGDPRTGTDLGVWGGQPPVGRALAPLVDAVPAADVAIDVSVPAASVRFVQRMAQAGLPVLVATTGHDPGERAAIERCAGRIPVLWAPNLSVGIALLGSLVERLAAVLGTEADVEIVEAHHRHKRDAPSGTALALARRVARARGQALREALRTGRHGRSEGQRPQGEIGLHAVRAGEIVGEHTVVFAWGRERLELVHRAGDRDVFAAGALRVAGFLADTTAPGLYGVEDALQPPP
ncbi:MAG: 4-hydroxy-tetrahydrodipicolinate reductase [Planctomycetota bacterium]|nr:MAG: 4-hydroxy-tetrahydrodipicolinate reductase [Planctomycetota bacterium]